MIITISMLYYIYTCTHSLFVIDISGIWLITQLYSFNTPLNTHHSLCVFTFSAFVSILLPFLYTLMN